MNGDEAIDCIQTSRGKFFISPRRDKKMAEALRSGRYPNKELLAIARRFLHEKSVVVDIGAHIGTFAIPIAEAGAKVIAFEPSPHTASLLQRNVQERGVDVTMSTKALGSEKGSGTLVVRNTTNAGANTFVAGGDIPITTLDAEVEHADLIKMDVEGMELDVLRGGAHLIERSRPVVLFEVNLSQLRAHGATPRALERYFIEHRYHLYFSLEGKKRVYASVESATLLTAFIAPRAWLFFGESAPFDLIAVPEERSAPGPIIGFGAALLSVLRHNLLLKVRRARLWMAV